MGGRSGQVNSGFRKAVTFDVVRRALKDLEKMACKWKVHSEAGRHACTGPVWAGTGSLERSIRVMGNGEVGTNPVLQTGMRGWPKPGRFGLSPDHQC